LAGGAAYVVPTPMRGVSHCTTGLWLVSFCFYYHYYQVAWALVVRSFPPRWVALHTFTLPLYTLPLRSVCRSAVITLLIPTARLVCYCKSTHSTDGRSAVPRMQVYACRAWYAAAPFRLRWFFTLYTVARTDIYYRPGVLWFHHCWPFGSPRLIYNHWLSSFCHFPDGLAAVYRVLLVCVV